MKANIILAGPMGTGKTSSLLTIPEKYEICVIATEPGVLNILGKAPRHIHTKYIPPARPSWDTIKRNAELISSMSNEQLQKMQKINQRDYEQFLEFIGTCSSYKCDRCGADLGAIDDWDDNRVLVVDGLSGLTAMAMDLVVGAKPIKSLPDYLVSMDNLERIVQKLCVDTKCSFIMTAHVTRTVDEVNGGTFVTIDTIGQKLAPKIPRFFDECIWTRRDRDKFSWSTVENNVDLKTRFLPFRDDLRQDFSQIFNEENEEKARMALQE